MRRRSWRFAAVTSHGETYSFLAFESERTERTQRGPQQRRPPISAPGTFLLPGFVSIESLTIFGAKSGAFDVTALSMYPNTLSPHFHTFRGVCTCIFFYSLSFFIDTSLARLAGREKLLIISSLTNFRLIREGLLFGLRTIGQSSIVDTLSRSVSLYSGRPPVSVPQVLSSRREQRERATHTHGERSYGPRGIVRSTARSVFLNAS